MLNTMFPEGIVRNFDGKPRHRDFKTAVFFINFAWRHRYMQNSNLNNTNQQ